MHAHITSLSLAALVLVAGSPVSAQVIEINDGETLTEDDLFAGSFNGQPFTLNPDLTFDINSGGTMGPIDFPGPELPGTGPGSSNGPIDFAGSLISVNTGGQFVHGLGLRGFENLRLIVSDGASMPYGLWGFRGGCDLSVEGGQIQGFLTVSGESHATFTGGIQDIINIDEGASAEFLGGIRLTLRTFVNSDVALVGDDFWIDGAPIGPGDSSYAGAGPFGGTHPDGSVFIDFPRDYDSRGEISLVHTPLPPPDLTPIIVPDQDAPEGGLRPGQSLTLRDGGMIRDRYSVLGGTLNVEGGSVGQTLKLMGSECLVSGGTLSVAYLFGGASMHVSGGRVEGDLIALQSDIVEISGGEIAQRLQLLGTNAEIRGGSVDRVQTQDGSDVDISGGEVLNAVGINDNGSLRLSGGRVQDLYLSDEARFVFEGGSIDGHFKMFDSPSVLIRGGAVPDDVEFAGSVEIESGSVGDNSSLASDSTLRVTGGSVGDVFRCRRRNTVEITGGSIGDGFGLRRGTFALISGGTIGSINLEGQSEAVMSGGSIGDQCTINQNSRMTISGGVVGERFNLLTGTLDLVVRSLAIGGQAVPIVPGDRIEIDERNVTLEAVLSDGTPLAFFLNTDLSAPHLGYFDPNATLTAVGAPAVPCSAADLAEPFATLDLADLVAFVGAFLAQSDIADLNGDGVLDLDDVSLFVDAFGAGCGS